MARPAPLVIVVVAAAIGLVTHAQAGDPRRGIFGDDDRRPIQQLSTPWSAIGQVNVAGHRRISKCTGSLIAPNLVITAAHCVMDPWNRKPFPARDVHFLAGVRGSTWLGHSRAKCVHFRDGYEYRGSNESLSGSRPKAVPRDALVDDLAVIVLESDLKDISPLELETGDAATSAGSLVHASYPADRRYMLTGHFGCRVLKRDPDLWLTDCDTHAASSGGPVFTQENGRLKLAAIMVAVAGKSGSLAVPIANGVDAVAEKRCP